MNTPEVESRLLKVIEEIEQQRESILYEFKGDEDFQWQLALLREYVEVGECGLAYECLICWCELIPMKFSSSAVVMFIELALHFGFKTTREEDARFDLTEHWLGGCKSNVFKSGPAQDQPRRST